jgi:hypothetical protein
MINPLRATREWRRLRDFIRMIARSQSCQADRIELCFPPDSWYAGNADEMLQITEGIAGRLERELELSFPGRVYCYVTDSETAEAIQGAMGCAYRTMVVIGVPPRHLSTYAGVAAHELSHLLSRRLREYPLPFLSEGFACYGAWRIEEQKRPMGMPLHYHLVWLLSVGVRPTLEELWHRQDYTPELYDLAWSFAAFAADQFGCEHYYSFYRARIRDLRERAEATLGIALARLEKDWIAHARSRVPVEPSQIRRMRRYDGFMCSRAAWLGRQ